MPPRPQDEFSTIISFCLLEEITQVDLRGAPINADLLADFLHGGMPGQNGLKNLLGAWRELNYSYCKLVTWITKKPIVRSPEADYSARTTGFVYIVYARWRQASRGENPTILEGKPYQLSEILITHVCHSR
jgi:hypothetical protein